MAAEHGRGRASVAPGAAWPEEFVDFYRRHFAGVARMAAAMTGRADVAEEITQDAFVALARRWDGVSHPYGYLRRSVANAAHDHLAHRRRDRDALAMHRPEPVASPEVLETEAVLAGLAPRRQAALALRFFADLDYDEIARILDCRPATARSLVHRGLKELRRKLS